MIGSFLILRYGYKNEEYPYFVIFILIGFGLNIAGAILGIGELKNNKGKALLGLVSNSLFVLINISFMLYVIASIWEKDQMLTQCIQNLTSLQDLHTRGPLAVTLKNGNF